MRASGAAASDGSSPAVSAKCPAWEMPNSCGGVAFHRELAHTTLGAHVNRT
jgi:hypothetical protein